MSNKNKKARPIECFISMPFSEEFDDVYTEGLLNINDHIKEYFVDFVRLDKNAYDQRRIEENVLKNIGHSNLLVADISRYPDSPQPNVSVMHEIGYACGKGIPFILIGKLGTHKKLPSNLKGSIVTEYDTEKDKELKDFSHRLAKQFSKTIKEEVLTTVRGQFQAEVFSERYKINIPLLIENASRRIYILTTNLNYTFTSLRESIQSAINENDGNLKIELLTMDPESDVANARAMQLGRPIRQYRDELRSSLDNMRNEFGSSPSVEIITYRSLPTQMTFIIDDTVVTAIVSLGHQSREGIHLVLAKTPEGVEPFLSHFRVLKTLAVANSSA